MSVNIHTYMHMLSLQTCQAVRCYSMHHHLLPLYLMYTSGVIVIGHADLNIWRHTAFNGALMVTLTSVGKSNDTGITNASPIGWSSITWHYMMCWLPSRFHYVLIESRWTSEQHLPGFILPVTELLFVFFQPNAHHPGLKEKNTSNRNISNNS